MQGRLDFQHSSWCDQAHKKRHNMVTGHGIPEQEQALFRKVLIASVYFSKGRKKSEIRKVKAGFEQSVENEKPGQWDPLSMHCVPQDIFHL